MSTITLALSLKRSLAPVTTNRTFHAKTYKNCFLGTDAVLALKNLFPHPEGLALERGNELIQSGLCGHVVAEHMFVDTGKMLYYRFDDARIIEALEAENEANDFFNNGLRADKRETEVSSYTMHTYTRCTHTLCIHTHDACMHTTHACTRRSTYIHDEAHTYTR